MKNGIVITGKGLVSSLGLNPQDTWDALLSGKSGVKPIEGFDASGFDCRAAAQAGGLDPFNLGIHPRDSRIMDKHSYMLIKCLGDAFAEAGINSSSVRGADIGFFAGMGMVDYNAEDLLHAVISSTDSEGNIDYDKFYSRGFREIHPLWPLSMLNNITFCQAAIRFGIRGENAVFSPHADSGAQAIAEGAKTLLEEKARIVFAGGVSEKITPLSLARLYLTGALNSTEGNNAVPGEGCGIIAMELRSSADERKIPYTTMIAGFGFACEPDDKAKGPTSDAIANAMRTALREASLNPSDIDVIIVDGCGKSEDSRHEAEAVRQVFSASQGRIKVISSGASLGYLFAAAPAVDLILGMHVIEHGIIPAALNAAPHEKAAFSPAQGEPAKTRPERILVNCQSCEGQVAAIIITKA